MGCSVYGTGVRDNKWRRTCITLRTVLTHFESSVFPLPSESETHTESDYSLKYSITFDLLLSSGCGVFTESRYTRNCSEAVKTVFTNVLLITAELVAVYAVSSVLRNALEKYLETIKPLRKPVPTNNC
jgi:hypothetical protein